MHSFECNIVSVLKMESNSSSAIKLFSHPETNRLNCFDGSNFTRWKDKMTFLLTTLKVFYVLSEDLAVIPSLSSDESEDIKRRGRKEKKMNWYVVGIF